MKNVLLIAGLSEAYYFDLFVDACKNRDINIFLFDPLCFPDKANITLSMDNTGKIEGFIDVVLYKIGYLENVRLSIQDIDTAWYLREGDEKVKRKRSIAERFSRNESRATLHSLYSTLPCKWINKKETLDFVTSNKFFQQQIALQSGLSVPATLVSNDHSRLVSLAEIKNGLLLKSLGYIDLDKKGEYFLYSEKFSTEEISNSKESIQHCPVFAQEYIEKLYEYRVMAIGNRILACRIDSQSSNMTKIDWRHYDFSKVEHLQVELPKDLQEKLLDFMKKIGLKYGAIDLIETPDGKFIFLEINPSGQWGWIHDFAKLPIPEAVADMLEFS